MTFADRRRPFLAGVAVLAAALSWLVAVPSAGTPAGPAPVTAVVDPALRGVHGTVGVIVQGTRSVESSVRRMGGSITHRLPLIGGFSARVPATDIPRIAHLPGARSVTFDGPVQVMGTTDGSAPKDVYKKVVRADTLQSSGYAGQGVTVALIDTGVTPMADLEGRIVPVAVDAAGTLGSCVNFSAEPTCADNYGHGTFLAGLIAGTGASSGGQYVGVAPQSRIVSVKIAGRNGSADVSNVIAALQWVVAFKDVYGIKVLNLSLGTNSTQPYQLSPLDYAVEKAWQTGITVVVSASNLGPDPRTISKPGDDPFVITVGATDDMGTPGLGDDAVPNFSSRGPTAADGLAKPDVAAPGAHLVSLAAPGAAITTEFPSSMTAPYRSGSGTSMSTAVVSGLVADILSAHPTWTPNRVKFALTSTARPDASPDRMAVGAGVVDGTAALTAPAGVANGGVAPSLGTGSLQADRGTLDVQLVDADGNVTADPLSGDYTAQLVTWDPVELLFATFTGSNWYGSNWYGSNWYGSNWYGSNWYGSNWYGSNWYGSNWYGSNWYGSNWYGAWDQ